MPTSREPPDAVAGASSAGATGSQPQGDPQQEAVRTAKGVEFLQAGSGNSLGDGRTAGGSANVAAREVLPDTNAGADTKDDGSSPTKVDPDPHDRAGTASAPDQPSHPEHTSPR